jgi:hypothetical protein
MSRGTHVGILLLLTFTATGLLPAQSIMAPPQYLRFSTYVGGDGRDALTGAAVDSAGRAHVVGNTCSPAIATTSDALRRTPEQCEGYLAVYSPDGALLYATLIGGTGTDTLTAVVLDGAGSIYLAGWTSSADLPTTPGAFDRECDRDGTSCSDGFVMKLAPLGRYIEWSTFLGGADLDRASAGFAVDRWGRVHVAGSTRSVDFPVTPGAISASLTGSASEDAFYTRLRADGSGIEYSTYLGGSANDNGATLTVDNAGSAYIAGSTYSTDFPTLNAAQPANGGYADTWLVKIAADNFAEFSTYLGRESNDLPWRLETDGTSAYLLAESCSYGWPDGRPDSYACGPYLGKVSAAGAVPFSTYPPGTLRHAAMRMDSSERAYLWAESWHAGLFLMIVDLNAERLGTVLHKATIGSAGPYERRTRPTDLALDGAGGAYLVGETGGYAFPLVNPIDREVESGSDGQDGILARMAVEDIPRRDIAGEVVLQASDVDVKTGQWYFMDDLSAAGGKRLANPNVYAPKLAAPLANPPDYVEFEFTAEAGAYRLWLRAKPDWESADDIDWANDSVHVQFSDSVDAGGASTWRIGTTSGTSVNLEDCAGCGIDGWGWQDNGYGAGVLGPLVRFATSGTHRIRIQPREDGLAFDQIVLSRSRYLTSAPGALKRDVVVLARSHSDPSAPPPPPPPACDTREIVIHPGVTADAHGAWIVEAEESAGSRKAVRHPDAGGAKLAAALASPAHYFDVTFQAEAGVDYRLWLRGRAQNNYWANDSVFVQFSGSVDAEGVANWRIGTTGATTVNLEDASNSGLSGWGWQDNGYGAGVLGPLVRFAASGPQTLRVQTREDGLAIDHILLSASRYKTSAPGQLKNDATILQPCGGGTPAPPPPPPGGREIVLYPARDATTVGGRWTRFTADGPPGGRVSYPDRGDPKINQPLAQTAEVLELDFDAEAGVLYRLWLRGRAAGDHWANDSVWVQFSGTVNEMGVAIFRMGTTQGSWINLEECSGCGLSGWGWQDNGYGAPGMLGEEIYFEQTGRQTIRIQPREDGITIDQIVISAGRFVTQAPGSAKNDMTIVGR